LDGYNLLLTESVWGVDRTVDPFSFKITTLECRSLLLKRRRQAPHSKRKFDDFCRMPDLKSGSLIRKPLLSE
jgi:hypothetical protein